MEKFAVVTGVAAPMLMTNINTDLIAPSLMPGHSPEDTAKLTLRDKMFANLRFTPDGKARADFVLNQPRYAQARIILAGPNFGCGSSRETAVWSLMEAGIRCVIAPSFGDIFHDNAYQNGLLPLKLDMPSIEKIAGALQRSNAAEMTIDLTRCELLVPGMDPVRFELPDDRRAPLLDGVDQLDFMLGSLDTIARWQRDDASARPWIYSAVG